MANVARATAGVGILFRSRGRLRRAGRNHDGADTAALTRIDRDADRLERRPAARVDLGNSAAREPPRALSSDRDRAARRRIARGARALPARLALADARRASSGHGPAGIRVADRAGLVHARLRAHLALCARFASDARSCGEHGLPAAADAVGTNTDSECQIACISTYWASPARSWAASP